MQCTASHFETSTGYTWYSQWADKEHRSQFYTTTGQSALVIAVAIVAGTAPGGTGQQGVNPVLQAGAHFIRAGGQCHKIPEKHATYKSNRAAMGDN